MKRYIPANQFPCSYQDNGSKLVTVENCERCKKCTRCDIYATALDNNINEED